VTRERLWREAIVLDDLAAIQAVLEDRPDHGVLEAADHGFLDAYNVPASAAR